jgi:hypothetical protein
MESGGFGFMKSGGIADGSASALPFSESEIKELLSLFISNALITATKYSKFCKRNGVTKKDINLGLKYEVREFFNRNTLVDDMKEIQDEFARMEEEEPIKFKVEYIDTRIGSIEESELFENEDDAEDFICEQEKYDYFTEFTIIELTESDLMMDEVVTEDRNIEPFAKITPEQIRDLNFVDRQFISKIHTHDSSWSGWVPETPLHTILKNGVESMMQHE